MMSARRTDPSVAAHPGARDAPAGDLAHVVANGVATVTELTDLTGAGVMTVHRDLDEPARRGVVRKFHGWASAQPSTVFESSSEYRIRVQVREKEALATPALELIEPRMSIMLDTPTTNLFVARRLGDLGHGPLTVVTNHLPIMQPVRTMPDIHLIGVGGDYNSTHDAFLGMSAMEAIGALTVDIVLHSTSVVTAATTYHQEPHVVTVKRAMMAARSSHESHQAEPHGAAPARPDVGLPLPLR